MERRLILMRHAKSDWASGALSDHERPLNARGRRDAPRVAARLLELGWAPEAVVSSDAARTTETWERMGPAFPGVPVSFSRRLYHAGLGAIWESSRSWSPEVQTVLVLGHNPGWEEALASLSGQRSRMTTANAALLRGAGADWLSAIEGEWRLEALLRPRDLDAGAP